MSETRFDGRVAIVTGAGGRPSLGRSYAHLLAARGAKVVVNDLGVGPDGRGVVRASAEAVAQEIRDAGGEAIADTNSVAEEESARAVVQTALDAWGQVDILVNNAGVAILAEFDEISGADIEKVVQVHVLGNIWMCRAVWPHMKSQGYGRIVSASSGAFLGTKYVTIYGSAKGAVVSLIRGLAIEGKQDGIKANAIGPAALTIALETLSKETMTQYAPPAEMVAPIVAYLCHEDCPHNGGYFESGGGHTSMRRFAETKGYTNPEATLEDIRDNFEQIMSVDEIELTPEPDDNPMASVIDPKPYQPA
jgi:NAD(P)-dependent dehydrogenase (short-subunit alcohol dehydrogenase family)